MKLAFVSFLPLSTLSNHLSISSTGLFHIIHSEGLFSLGNSLKPSICCLFLITKDIVYGVCLNSVIFLSKGIFSSFAIAQSAAIALLLAIFLGLLRQVLETYNTLLIGLLHLWANY